MTTEEKIEPDAWKYYVGHPKNGWYDVNTTKSEKSAEMLGDKIERLFSAETITEVINKQITHHEKIKVDAWKKFEDTADSEVRERAEKHSEIIASLKEVREVFAE